MRPRLVSLLVVSPHGIVRAGVASMLTDVPGIRARVGGTADLRHRPQVALIHLGRSGYETLDLAALVPPTVAVLGLVDTRYRSTVAVTGVATYLDLSVEPLDLVAAVRAGAARTPPPSLRRGDDATGPTLSPREVEILVAIARGLSNSAIAAELYLGINTVKTYIRTAYRRIGAQSRSHAMLWCLRNGLVDPWTPRTWTSVPTVQPAQAARSHLELDHGV